MSTQKTGKVGFQINHQVMLSVVLFVLVVGFGIAEPAFFYPDVLLDVFAIVGEIGIMALGMTYVISTAGVDLSVGFNLQTSAIVFGMTLAATGNVFLAMLLALLTGAALGAFNGVVVAKGKIPPLVATLATMYLFRGISLILVGTEVYSGFPEGFQAISTAKVFGALPVQALYFVGLFLLFDLFFTRSSLGTNLKGMGFNEDAVKFSGVKTDKIKIWIYTLLGLLCGFAALLYLGRLSAAKSGMGQFMNFQVITAVLLGGTSIMGGVASMRGTFLAVLIIGVLKKGLSLQGLSGNVYNFSIGLILIASLIVVALEEKQQEKVTGTTTPPPSET